MSTTNVMEVITRGSFEVTDNGTCSSAGNYSRPTSSTSSTVRTESQLSLEYLPPDEPYYKHAHTEDHETSAEDTESLPRDSGEETAGELYSRIQEFSEKIRTELGNLRDTVSPESTPSDEERERCSGGATHLPLSSRAEASLHHHPPTEGKSWMMDSSGASRSEDTVQENYGSKVFVPIFDQEIRDTNKDEDIPLTAAFSDVHDVKSYSQSSNSAFDNGGSAMFMDPKLQKAIEKMKKLDKTLADLTKKEREVKRQRKLLEQQNEGTPNALVPLEYEADEMTLATSPVFHTQLLEESSEAGDVTNTPSVDVNIGVKDAETQQKKMGEDACKSKPKPRQQHQKMELGTDFIKRNIELASEASTLVAMTEMEKKRLEELLADDQEPEDPYSAPLGLPAVGEGFDYDRQELDRMRDIDSRLQALMPPEDWESMRSTSRNLTPSTHSLGPPEPDGSSTEEPMKVTTAKHIGPGEEVLQQFQMSREESQKLSDIEERLQALQEEKQHEPEAVPFLPPSELQALLDQCMREQNLLPAPPSELPTSTIIPQ